MPRRFSHVYQFKVVLNGTKPPIWRRIQVPESSTFWDLHVAIQDAMGWLDYHLHEFEIKNPVTGVRAHIGIPDEDGLSDLPSLPGWHVKMVAYFSPDNLRARYTYDFGDDWEHTVTLERVLPREPRVQYPRCLAGRRACPPEDCGGIYGYAEFLEAIQNPHHDEHQAMLDWVGGAYDPDDFHPDQVHFEDPAARWKIAFQDQ